jgi:hypothetical protein
VCTVVLAEKITLRPFSTSVLAIFSYRSKARSFDPNASKTSAAADKEDAKRNKNDAYARRRKEEQD